MQVDTQQAALDADPGSMDQRSPAGQARQFSHTFQRADDRSSGACFVAQYFNRGDKWCQLPGP